MLLEIKFSEISKCGNNVYQRLCTIEDRGGVVKTVNIIMFCSCRVKCFYHVLDSIG